MVVDLVRRKGVATAAEDALKSFRPDVVISDSEVFTHWTADRLRIPRITFDHFATLAYGDVPLPLVDRIYVGGWRLLYRALFGRPDRVVGSSFFPVRPRRSGVCLVGPTIRDAVRRAQPTAGEHLLVYLSGGAELFTPGLEQMLLAQDCPVRIYGLPRTDRLRNLDFKPVSYDVFIDDLASCRAVLGTTGNQLLGEIHYLGKRMLGIPALSLEQRINAYQMERMGFGSWLDPDRITANVIRDFLAQASSSVGAGSNGFVDGVPQAVAALRTFLDEVTAGRGGSEAIA